MKKFVTTNITTKEGTFYCQFKTLTDNYRLFTCNGRSLYECYSRPSNSKVCAYNYCVRLVREIFNVISANYPWFSYDNFRNDYDYGISGYNSCMFTFNANFYKDDVLIGRLHCTHTKTEFELADEYTPLFGIECLNRGC